jgi:hypothetical protein
MAIFADEFLFFNVAALPALLPTLANGAAFIMISSVSPDGDNPVTQVIDTTYSDGTPVVKKLNWNQACEPCKRKGLQDTCTHIARPPQHFQSYTGQERLNRLMSFNAEAFDREMLNIGGKPSITSAFDRHWIDYMVDNYYECDRAIDHIFITIDPSAGMMRYARSALALKS